MISQKSGEQCLTIFQKSSSINTEISDNENFIPGKKVNSKSELLHIQEAQFLRLYDD